MNAIPRRCGRPPGEYLAAQTPVNPPPIIAVFEHDLGKRAGPLSIAVLQFFLVYLLHRSVRTTPETKRG